MSARTMCSLGATGDSILIELHIWVMARRLGCFTVRDIDVRAERRAMTHVMQHTGPTTAIPNNKPSCPNNLANALVVGASVAHELDTTEAPTADVADDLRYQDMTAKTSSPTTKQTTQLQSTFCLTELDLSNKQ